MAILLLDQCWHACGVYTQKCACLGWGRSPSLGMISSSLLDFIKQALMFQEYLVYTGWNRLSWQEFINRPVTCKSLVVHVLEQRQRYATSYLICFRSVLLHHRKWKVCKWMKISLWVQAQAQDGPLAKAQKLYSSYVARARGDEWFSLHDIFSYAKANLKYWIKAIPLGIDSTVKGYWFLWI